MKVQVRFGIVILGEGKSFWTWEGRRELSRSKEEGSWEVGGRELDLREEKGVVQVQKRRKSRVRGRKMDLRSKK